MKLLTEKQVRNAVDKFFDLAEKNIAMQKKSKKRIGDRFILSSSDAFHGVMVMLELVDKLKYGMKVETPILVIMDKANTPRQLGTMAEVEPIDENTIIVMYNYTRKPDFNKNIAMIKQYALLKLNMTESLEWRPDNILPEDYYM